MLFIKDGQVFHQIYRGNLTNDELYVKIQDCATFDLKKASVKAKPAFAATFIKLVGFWFHLKLQVKR